VRGGRVTSDYKGAMKGIGETRYDSGSNYWAAHLGVGKAFQINAKNTLDGYLKYFYSHQAGEDITVQFPGLAIDGRMNFDSVDSHRVRLGARLTHRINEKNSFYGGLAYQYEFGGDARAHYDGNMTPSPSVKGSSGMLDLGWQVKPGVIPVTIDLGVTGWFGKQRGVTAGLQAIWSL
jgi:outer membrane autotransporter protein